MSAKTPQEICRLFQRSKQVVEVGNIALMHTEWNVSGTQPITVHAIEVARRQPDGTWRWLISNPYTVGIMSAPRAKAADARLMGTALPSRD